MFKDEFSFSYRFVSIIKSPFSAGFVRIYFETATFDRITKDRAAKFVDILSAIGGTMGLLTGFSIISGVEIFYFVAKLILESFWNKQIVISKK